MENLLSQCQANVFPAMLDDFAEGLGLSAQPFADLGIGYMPDEGAWVCPERDTTGKIVGLLRRFEDGKKYLVKGGQRGFIYAVNPQYATKKYDSSKYHWLRCTKECPCPICDKPDWCMVSSDDPANPGAVLCARIAEGAKKQIGESGYLHTLKKQSPTENYSLLAASDYPVVFTEGMTDWAAATHLGFVAVGRPSATFVDDKLSKLIAGREVIIVGDNDPNGVGAMGVDKVTRSIEVSATSVTSVFPPDGIKDLREWVTNGLTRVDFLAYIKKHGKTTRYDLLPSNSALDLAEAWLRSQHNLNTTLSLRKHCGQWYRFRDSGYEVCALEKLRGELWDFLSDKNYMKITPNGEFIEAINPTTHIISNVVDALNRWCHVDETPPIWLSPRLQHIDPGWLIVFRNGILDVKDFIATKNTALIPATPELFTLSGIEYDYDPHATCSITDACVWDILSMDEDKWRLWWEWLGYNAIPSQMFEKLMLMIGQPRSGKGTLIALLTALLGYKQCASTTFADLCTNFGYEPLIGKLAVLMPDAQTGRGIDAGAAMEKIKTVTGGDPVGVNLKHKTAISYVKLQCRFTIAVNTIPQLPDQARALEPRLNVLALRECYIGREDRELKSKIIAELPGAMNRALGGLARLVTNMKFTEPEDSLQMKNEFRMVTTPLATFLEECCVVGDREHCSKHELFDCWKAWCSDNNMKPGTVMNLQQRLLSYSAAIASDKAELNGDTYAIYRGLMLNKHGLKLIGE